MMSGLSFQQMSSLSNTANIPLGRRLVPRSAVIHLLIITLDASAFQNHLYQLMCMGIALIRSIEEVPKDLVRMWILSGMVWNLLNGECTRLSGHDTSIQVVSHMIGTGRKGPDPKFSKLKLIILFFQRSLGHAKNSQ